MKKLILALLLLSMMVSLCACTRQKQVLHSIGEYDSEEFYTCGCSRDSTDYAKYHYAQPDLDNNKYFSVAGEAGIQTLCLYLDNFEGMLNSIRRTSPTSEVVVKYDFDRSVIDEQDYLYIYDRMDDPHGLDYEQFWDYDVYLFDVQTNVLYYFHNDI